MLILNVDDTGSKCCNYIISTGSTDKGTYEYSWMLRVACFRSFYLPDILMLNTLPEICSGNNIDYSLIKEQERCDLALGRTRKSFRVSDFWGWGCKDAARKCCWGCLPFGGVEDMESSSGKMWKIWVKWWRSGEFWSLFYECLHLTSWEKKECEQKKSQIYLSVANRFINLYLPTYS